MFSLLGLQLFMHLLCTNIGHDISNNHRTPCWIHIYLLSRFSGLNMFALMFLTLFYLIFPYSYGHILLYKYGRYCLPVLK